VSDLTLLEKEVKDLQGQLEVLEKKNAEMSKNHADVTSSLEKKVNDLTNMADTMFDMMERASQASNPRMDIQQRIFCEMKKGGFITTEDHHVVPHSVRMSLEGFFCAFEAAPYGGFFKQNMRTLNDWYMARFGDKDLN